MMKTAREMEEMAATAKAAAGWQEDGSRRTGGDADPRDRSYAEGVEAGILWALGYAGEPLPR